MGIMPYYFYPVWDPLLRALHWWNALTVAAQIITGSAILIFGEEIQGALCNDLVNIHATVGYMLAAGIFIRIVWLFIGPTAASWRDLLPLTGNQRRIIMETLKYYLSGLRSKPPLYLAHNSFAGIIYAVFFLLASTQVITGAVLLNILPEMRHRSAVLSWHGTGYLFIIIYIVAHIFAVFVHEWAERHGLISAMVHGNKTYTDDEWQELTSSEKTKVG